MSLTISTSGTAAVSLNGSFTFEDPTGVQSPLSKVIPAIISNLNAVTFGQAVVTTTPLVVSLPASPTTLLYVKNLSVAGILTFTWTPQGGTSVATIQVGPGGTLFFFTPGTGITALSVVASVNTTVDYVLGG